jgi:hypothetical protein
MFTYTRLILCIVAISFLAGCYSSTESRKIATDFDKFPVERKIEEVKLFEVDQLTPDYIDICKDSVIYLVSATGEKGYHFTLYGLAEKNFLPSQLPIGRKEGQALSFHSYGIGSDHFWAYDVNKEKIIYSRLANPADTGSRFFKEMRVPTYYYTVQLLNDTTLLASGDYESVDNYQISMVDLNKGSIVKQMAPYSSTDSVPYDRPRKTAYESFLFAKPSKDKAVLAYRYADRIEIVDLNSGKSKIVQGPEGFNPVMNVIVRTDGKKISTRGPDTRYAFVRGEVTNNFIYLLYSGNKEGTPHRFYGKYVYVYDWDGKPVQKLELSDDTKDFTVSGNDSLLYTYNPKTKYINVAKIKN